MRCVRVHAPPALLVLAATPLVVKGQPDLRGMFLSKCGTVESSADRPSLIMIRDQWHLSMGPSTITFALCSGPGALFPADENDPEEHCAPSDSLLHQDPPWVISLTFPGSRVVVPRGQQRFKAVIRTYQTESDCEELLDAFGSVVYQGLYQGVDLTIEPSDSGLLKYAYKLDRGADPSVLRMRFAGAAAEILSDQSLLLRTPAGDLRDASPAAWQDIPTGDSARREMIDCRYVLHSDQSVGFELAGPWDQSYPLIIDPEISWMMYLGGSDTDIGRDIALDKEGNSLVSGRTRSPEFSGSINTFSGGSFDAYVAKIAPSGELRWMTYIGGSRSDKGRGLAINGRNQALLVGVTDSRDLPLALNTYHGGEFDAFVGTVDADGRLLWSLYLGGSESDSCRVAALDARDNALIAGLTNSSDFEGAMNDRHGSSECFLAKVDIDGSLHWMTYIGGSSRDRGRGIAVDSGGGSIVSGMTESPDIEGAVNTLRGGEWDAFLCKVDADGEITWASYYGGSGSDEGYGVVIDAADNVFAVGRTSSTDFERSTTPYLGGNYDGYIFKCAPGGRIQWSTYLGGPLSDDAYMVALDGHGTPHVTGYSEGPDVRRRCSPPNGAWDASLTRVGKAGDIHWTRLLGGSDLDYCYGLAFDAAGDVRLHGATLSQDFEFASNPFRGMDWDAFYGVVNLHADPQLVMTLEGVCPDETRIRINGCVAESPVALLAASGPGSAEIMATECRGTVLGLAADDLRIVGWRLADESGSAEFVMPPPVSDCGQWLQGFSASTCGTSQVLQLR